MNSSKLDKHLYIKTTQKQLEALYGRTFCLYDIDELGYCSLINKGITIRDMPVTRLLSPDFLHYAYTDEGSIAFNTIQGITDHFNTYPKESIKAINDNLYNILTLLKYTEHKIMSKTQYQLLYTQYQRDNHSPYIIKDNTHDTRKAIKNNIEHTLENTIRLYT